jgi:hypothetical protein
MIAVVIGALICSVVAIAVSAWAARSARLSAHAADRA